MAAVTLRALCSRAVPQGPPAPCLAFWDGINKKVGLG